MRGLSSLFWIHLGSDSIAFLFDRIQFQLGTLRSICRSKEANLQGSCKFYLNRSKLFWCLFDRVGIHIHCWRSVVSELSMELYNRNFLFDCCKRDQVGTVCIFDRLNQKRLVHCIEHNSSRLQWIPVGSRLWLYSHPNLDQAEELIDFESRLSKDSKWGICQLWSSLNLNLNFY